MILSATVIRGDRSGQLIPIQPAHITPILLIWVTFLARAPFLGDADSSTIPGVALYAVAGVVAFNINDGARLAQVLTSGLTRGSTGVLLVWPVADELGGERRRGEYRQGDEQREHDSGHYDATLVDLFASELNSRKPTTPFYIHTSHKCVTGRIS